MTTSDAATPDRYRLVPQMVNGVEIRVFADAPTSMRELLVGSAAFGERDFVVSGDHRLTYVEHFDLVAGLAVRMHDVYGVRPGVRVAIAMRNRLEWVIAFWATQVLGAVSVPLNAWWTGPELAYGLKDSGATVAFLDGERYERLAPLLPELQLKAVVVTDHHGVLDTGCEHWATVRSHVVLGAALPDVAIGPDDLATILYTSGRPGVRRAQSGRSETTSRT